MGIPGSEVTGQALFGAHLLGERSDIFDPCVPHFLVHTNRKGPMNEQTGADLAYNTIYTGKSVLTLYAEDIEV